MNVKAALKDFHGYGGFAGEKMRTCKKYFSVILVLMFIPLLSCSGKGNEMNPVLNVSYPERNFEVPEKALSVVEALQEVNHYVSETVLQSVVEVDVEETKTRNVNPLPFFFFGFPDDEGGFQKEYKAQGLGSGVIVLKDKNTYYVLTNNHVAGSASKITVKLNNSREFECKLVGHDERKDIALVSFESKDDIPVARLGNSDNVKTGDICLAMGAPLGYSQSVTQGIVSATGRSGSGIGNISDFIQTDASINQGNSGGPLVNIYGEVIGINTWIASSSGGSVGIGFAIPINNIKKAISDFVSKGKVSYGWLGVSLVEVDEEFLKEIDVSDKKGAFVSQVFLNSPAAKGGMLVGDFIISLNGRPVKDVNQLVREVGELTEGDVANFEMIRSGKKVDLSVKIDGRDDSIVNDSSKLWPGFFVRAITDEMREKLKLPRTVDGVQVYNVQAKSPASSLRLQNGDIIIGVNGTKIRNVKEFYAELAENQKECWFEIYTSEGHTIKTTTFVF